MVKQPVQSLIPQPLPVQAQRPLTVTASTSNLLLRGHVSQFQQFHAQADGRLLVLVVWEHGQELVQGIDQNLVFS
jgi:hypothetical protein